jgi:hypothetical protein
MVLQRWKSKRLGKKNQDMAFTLGLDALWLFVRGLVLPTYSILSFDFDFILT